MAELITQKDFANSGIKAIAVTGTAVQLSSTATASNAIAGIVMKAVSTNANPVTIGGASGVTNALTSSGNGYILAQGESLTLPISDPQKLWINGTAGDLVTWISF